MLEPRVSYRAMVLMATAMLASASTIPTNNLFEQSSSACMADYSHCDAAANLPPNMCCRNGSTCAALAGNTTIVCCPEDSDCSLVAPTSCNVTLQDPNLYPGAVFQTTALHGQLAHCGDGTCCPYGYSCDAQQHCQMDKNQNPKPFQSVPPESTGTTSPSRASTTSTGATTPTSSIQIIPTSSSSSRTSTGGAGPVTTTSPDTNPSATPEDAGNTGGTPTAVIAGAVVGAILLLAAAAFIAWVFLKRRTKKREDEDALKLTRSTSSFGNIISNPIMSGNSTMRTDFVRKSPGRSSRGSVGSFGNDSTLGPGTPTPPRPTRDGTSGIGGSRIPPIRGMAQARQSSIAYGFGAPNTSPYANPPQTPPQQREPSSISINVFADPRTVGTPPERGRDARLSHQTTFSDMLRSADLGGVARGEPYVPPTPRNGTPGSKLRP